MLVDEARLTAEVLNVAAEPDGARVDILDECLEGIQRGRRNGTSISPTSRLL